LRSGRRITSRGQKDLDQIAGQVCMVGGWVGGWVAPGIVAGGARDLVIWTGDVPTMLILN
jgi:hypothetical protein